MTENNNYLINYYSERLTKGLASTDQETYDRLVQIEGEMSKWYAKYDRETFGKMLDTLEMLNDGLLEHNGAAYHESVETLIAMWDLIDVINFQESEGK